MALEHSNIVSDSSFISESEKSKKQRKAGVAWSIEEDQKLLKAVQSLGEKRWVEISKLVGTRSRKQCRERYINHVSPSIDKRPWSIEEDEKIFRAYYVLGNKWSEISKTLCGRTARAVRNRYKTLSVHQKLSCFNTVDKNQYKVIIGGSIW